MIVHELLVLSLTHIRRYPIFRSRNGAHLKHYSLNNISLIFGMGYGFCFNYLFIFLKSLRKCTRFVLGLGCVKDGAPHSESFAKSRTLSRNKRTTYFWTFPRVPLVLDMFSNISASIPLLIWSLLDMFCWYQFFHQRSLKFFVLMLAISYVVTISTLQ